ncbi:hypothetical protein PWT90_03878 [Aphanocladium album]|nr:hypothetical protein PWT90_03878 [Aphanocladium album]
MTDPSNHRSQSWIRKFMLENENEILNYFPCFLILGLFTSAAYHYMQRPTGRSRIYGARPLLIGAYVLLIIEVVAIALRATSSSVIVKETRAASSLNLLATVTFFLVVFTAHHYNVYSPYRFSLYFIIGMAVDSTRSVCLFHHQLVWAARFAAMAGLARFLLLLVSQAFQLGLLEDGEDFQLFDELYENGDPDISFFRSLDSKSLRRLQRGSSLQELPGLGRGLSSRLLHAQLQRNWSIWNYSRAHSLSVTCLRTWRNSVAAALLLPATKMIALAPTVTEHIANLQATEVSHYRSYQSIRAVSNLFTAISRILSPAVVIGAALYARSMDAEASITAIFPTLNLISLLSNPLASLLDEYTNVIAMHSSFYQIQEFLSLEEREECRVIAARANGSGSQNTVAASSSHAQARAVQVRAANFIQFSTASIIPYGADTPIFTNVDFSLNPGSITAVVGTRRSGKSVLLEAMLGETKLRDGSAYVGDDIVGFSGQHVWLQNLSVRDNIIGPHLFDIRRFKLVIRCCLLQEDIKSFPGGDCFVIGVGGSKLSNGQRQRLALARAVYANPSLLLLDDTFASLDRRTAASILFRLCGKDGLLKSSNCTVVFATSLAEIADVADQFLLLDRNTQTVRIQPNDGQLQIAEFLRAQHVSAPEAVEEQQRNAIHRVLHGTAAGKAAVATSGPKTFSLGETLHQVTDLIPTCIFQLFYYGTLLLMQCNIATDGSKLWTAALFFAVYEMCRSFVRKSMHIRGINSNRKKLLHILFQETGDGQIHCRALGWQSFHFEQGLRLIDDSLKAFFYTNHVNNWAETNASTFTACLATSLTILVLFFDCNKSAVAIALSLHHISHLNDTIWRILESAVLSGETKTALSELFSWQRETPQEFDPPTSEVPDTWPHAGRIVLRNVSARYGPDMPDVLHNISLTVNPEDKVCIFGRTGSGKSTLLLLLLGFLEYNGTIEIDGIDIATVPRQILRSRIISASQYQVELEGTIRSNLLPYEIPVAEVETEADRAVRIADEDEILKDFLIDMGIWNEIQCKGGLYASIQTAELSKTVLQTLGFARTVLRYHRSEGKLVLLDEATNGLDPEQDTAVQRLIWEFFEGCSIVQIAHLEESTQDSELSIEISDGTIVHVQRGPDLLPGVQRRNAPPLSPDSMIMSAGSDLTTLNPASSLGNEMLSEHDEALPEIPALEPLADDFVPPDELMLSLCDHMMSPRRVLLSGSGLVLPSAHRVLSMYRSTPSIGGTSASIAAEQRPTTNYSQAWITSDAFSEQHLQRNELNWSDTELYTNGGHSTTPNPGQTAYRSLNETYEGESYHGYEEIQNSTFNHQQASNFDARPHNYHSSSHNFPASHHQLPIQSQAPRDSTISHHPMPDRGPVMNYNQILEYRSGAGSSAVDAHTTYEASSYYSSSSHETSSRRSAHMFH